MNLSMTNREVCEYAWDVARYHQRHVLVWEENGRLFCVSVKGSLHYEELSKRGTLYSLWIRPDGSIKYYDKRYKPK
jgi:hypothetical protein